MNQPTKKQTELLLLVAPRPYGKGLKITQAAKLLHISYSSAKYHLRKFRKDYPERWNQIKEMKENVELSKRLKKNLRRPLLVGALDWADISDNEPARPKNPNTRLCFDESDSKETSKTVYVKIREKF